MEKQEAVDFVLERIAHDYMQEEIARDLSHHLKAPPEILLQFVARVEQQHPHIRPLPVAEEPIQEDTLPPAFDQQPPPPAFTAGLDDFPDAESESVIPAPIPIIPEPAPMAESVVQSPPQPAAKPAFKSQILNDEKLLKVVYDSLKKGRKRSDITTYVCERTGMEWNEAQRFVAQVEVENFKKLSAHENIPYMIFGIGGAIVGFVVMMAGIAALAPYIIVFLKIPLELPVYISTYPDTAIAIFLTGFGLLVGGIVGIYMAVQAQANA
ncbi:MAG: YrzE family protein [Anaerolineales bacterium]|nr:YrzE family protein [Anaerolineales bacterium]